MRKFKVDAFVDRGSRSCSRGPQDCGSFEKETFYFTDASGMNKQKWTVSLNHKPANSEIEKGREGMYVVRNQFAVNEDAAGNGPNSRADKLQEDSSVAVQTTLKQRWKSGNILIISLPLGAGVLPAVFLLAAFFHADDSLMLRNETNVPYISDIGNHKPYSSVFTFGLSISALFGLWLIIVRYIQVECLYENTGSKSNFICFVAGLITIFGELLVASFQLSSQETVHYLGAFVHFAATLFFMVMQTWITHRHVPHETKAKLATLLVIIRGVLSSGLLIALVMFGVFLLPSLSSYNRKGYSVAQTAEWSMLVFVIFFMLTYLYDFWNLTCHVVVKNL